MLRVVNLCRVSTVQAAREMLCIEAFSIIICQLSCQHSFKNDPNTLLRDALIEVRPSNSGKCVSIYNGSNSLIITIQHMCSRCVCRGHGNDLLRPCHFFTSAPPLPLSLSYLPFVVLVKFQKTCKVATGSGSRKAWTNSPT